MIHSLRHYQSDEKFAEQRNVASSIEHFAFTFAQYCISLSYTIRNLPREIHLQTCVQIVPDVVETEFFL